MEAEFEGAVMEVSETKERVQSDGGRRRSGKLRLKD
jgi:hypothetical protein